MGLVSRAVARIRIFVRNYIFAALPPISPRRLWSSDALFHTDWTTTRIITVYYNNSNTTPSIRMFCWIYYALNTTTEIRKYVENKILRDSDRTQICFRLRMKKCLSLKPHWNPNPNLHRTRTRTHNPNQTTTKTYRSDRKCPGTTIGCGHSIGERSTHDRSGNRSVTLGNEKHW